MLKKTAIACALTSCIVCQPAIASEERQDAAGHVLTLSSIEFKKASEDYGDELFFNVTTYASNGVSTHYQVPTYPTHWHSARLDQVHDVPLWEGQVPEDGAIEIIVSLTERDAPPWNIDDLVGSVKLKLRQEGGEVVEDWSLYVERGLTTEECVERGVRSYTMTGNDSEYHLGFRFDQ